MNKVKIKSIFFTIFFVLPLTYLFKYFFPETGRLTGFLLILFLIIIFHNIARFLFSEKKKPAE